MEINRSTPLFVLAVAVMVTLSAIPGQCTGLLDGQIFRGKIGPAGNPDLPDTLHFNGGQFWSNICTECGFRPGAYSAHPSSEGTMFSGVLESPERGQFSYEGVITADGQINVRILWQRKRWYWTAQREILFIGHRIDQLETATAETINNRIMKHDPQSNPRCQNF